MTIINNIIGFSFAALSGICFAGGIAVLTGGRK